MVWTLARVERIDELLRRTRGRMSPSDAAVARAIMLDHSSRLANMGSETERLAGAKRFLKPLRDREAARLAAGPIELGESGSRIASFRSWLSDEPWKDRMRSIAKCDRIKKGVSRWDVSWLTGPGVTCFERAKERVDAERAGRPDATFLKGVVRSVELPRAIASLSDHYIVLEPGKQVRFMTVRRRCGASCYQRAARLRPPYSLGPSDYYPKYESKYFRFENKPK